MNSEYELKTQTEMKFRSSDDLASAKKKPIRDWEVPGTLQDIQARKRRGY